MILSIQRGVFIANILIYILYFNISITLTFHENNLIKPCIYFTFFDRIKCEKPNPNNLHFYNTEVSLHSKYSNMKKYLKLDLMYSLTRQGRYPQIAISTKHGSCK